MAATGILNLPNELLEQVFNNLDWNRSEHLVPVRPDITNISLTCRQLRRACLPVYFKHVRLRLAWDDDELVEPTLFKLRRECPHLMKHVRSVYIDTHFGNLPYLRHHLGHPHLSVPDTLQDWLESNGPVSAGHVEATVQSHQQQVERFAQDIFESCEYREVIRDCPGALREHADDLVKKLFSGARALRYTSANLLAEGAVLDATDTSNELSLSSAPASNVGFNTATVRHRRAYGQPREPTRTKSRDLKLQLDALVLVVLCLPPTIRSIVFEAVPKDHCAQDLWQSYFASQVASAAMQIFGDRLRSLTAIIPDYDELGIIGKLTTAKNLQKLEVIKSLSIGVDSKIRSSRHHVNFINELAKWHGLSARITQLTLWDINTDPQALVELIKGFTRAQTLMMNNINLLPDRQTARNFSDRMYMIWPTFLIDLRRQMPSLAVDLHNMRGHLTRTLGRSAITWLIEEAIPTGCTVDVERETRLLEDYESFQPLWLAEDSERGELAKKHREDGKLVDMAMGSRGKR